MNQNYATDTELLDAIRIDDSTAFEDIIGRYWFFLYQYSCGKTKSQQIAAEITRNIFIELWENRHFIPADFSLQVYLREKVRKSITYHLYKRIAEEPSDTELTESLESEFSLDNLRSAYRPVSQTPKNSADTISYATGEEPTSNKIQRQQNFIFGWRILVNNLVLGFRKTFF
ncbi:MAG TPA: hypothetical protein VGQ04_04005 [Chitinophagaceae bacterium]|nr:hypothetical protein [Chitinophagaceae bacterium]